MIENLEDKHMIYYVFNIYIVYLMNSIHFNWFNNKSI